MRKQTSVEILFCASIRLFVLILWMLSSQDSVYSTFNYRPKTEMTSKQVFADVQSELIPPHIKMYQSANFNATASPVGHEHLSLFMSTLSANCLQVTFGKSVGLVNKVREPMNVPVKPCHKIYVKDHFDQYEKHLGSNIIEKNLRPKTVTLAYMHAESDDNNYENNFLFKVIPVIVAGPKNNIKIYALLDDGSSETFIDKVISDYIGAKGPEKIVSVNTVNGMSKITKVNLVEIIIKGRYVNETFKLRDIKAVSNLDAKSQTARIDDLKRFKHLKDIAGELIYKDAIPNIIIGVDNWALLMPHEVRLGKRNEPAAIRTALGWTAFGQISGTSTKLKKVGLNRQISGTQRLSGDSQNNQNHPDLQNAPEKLSVDDVGPHYFKIKNEHVSSRTRESSQNDQDHRYRSQYRAEELAADNAKSQFKTKIVLSRRLGGNSETNQNYRSQNSPEELTVDDTEPHHFEVINVLNKKKSRKIGENSQKNQNYVHIKQDSQEVEVYETATHGFKIKGKHGLSRFGGESQRNQNNRHNLQNSAEELAAADNYNIDKKDDRRLSRIRGGEDQNRRYYLQNSPEEEAVEEVGTLSFFLK